MKTESLNGVELNLERMYKPDLSEEKPIYKKTGRTFYYNTIKKTIIIVNEN